MLWYSVGRNENNSVDSVILISENDPYFLRMIKCNLERNVDMYSTNATHKHNDENEADRENNI